MAGKFWTEEENDFIKNNYLIMKPIEMAEKLNRTVKSVWYRMQLFKLSKPEPQVGDKFGKLTLVEKYVENNGRQNRTMGVFDCDCGKEYRGVLSQVSTGNILSCGCLGGSHNAKELIEKGETFTHGMTNTRIYNIWYGMKNRCTNPKADYQNRYINRGITMCEDWKNFKIFYDWAIKTGYVEQKDCSLERIDIDKNYCPENCKWITWAEQAHNKSNSKNIIITAFNETKSIYAWTNDSRCPQLSVSAIAYRIHAGWEPEKAITQTPERDRKLGLDKWVRKYHPEIIDMYNEFYNIKVE